MYVSEWKSTQPKRAKSLQLLQFYLTCISTIFRVQMKTASTEGNTHEILEVYSDNSQDKVSGYLEYQRH